jgi:hypothetical protein
VPLKFIWQIVFNVREDSMSRMSTYRSTFLMRERASSWANSQLFLKALREQSKQTRTWLDHSRIASMEGYSHLRGRLLRYTSQASALHSRFCQFSQHASAPPWSRLRMAQILSELYAASNVRRGGSMPELGTLYNLSSFSLWFSPSTAEWYRRSN